MCGRPAVAAEALLATADAAEGWERIKATKNCLVLAERLAAGGKAAEAKQIYERLQESRAGESEDHIREAALRGLAALGAS